MTDLKATKVGINLFIKSMLGLGYRSTIAKVWDTSPEAYFDQQVRTFEKIYNFARQNVPYYSDKKEYPIFEEIRENNIFEILQKLPVLGKKEVRTNNEAFHSKPTSLLTKFHTTSGTSGTPLRISATFLERSLFHTNREEWYKRITGKRHPRTLNLSGFVIPKNEKDVIWHDRFTGDAYLSIYSLNDDNRSAILSEFQRLDPEMIYGYASAIHQLAILLKKDVESTKNKRISVTTSEVLQPDWRCDIESSLCKKVYDYYSSQEGCVAVMECGHGGLHINPLIGIIEVVDDNYQSVKDGQIGKLLLTSLVKYSMPLFRYEIGDVAQSKSYSFDCPCGLKWPLIGPVMGRSEDLVLTRDGRKIGYLCFHATKELRGIRECQFIQVGYNDFICNIVIDENFDVKRDYIEAKIKNQLKLRIRDIVNVKFIYLSEIPKGPEGKFKAVVVDFKKTKNI